MIGIFPYIHDNRDDEFQGVLSITEVDRYPPTYFIFDVQSVTISILNISSQRGGETVLFSEFISIILCICVTHTIAAIVIFIRLRHPWDACSYFIIDNEQPICPYDKKSL